MSQGQMAPRRRQRRRRGYRSRRVHDAPFAPRGRRSYARASLGSLGRNRPYLASVRVADDADGAPVFGCVNFSLRRGVFFALPQTVTTATSRPEALTSRCMSCGSLVRIVAFWRRATVTTTASTTSAVLVIASSRPAWCASLSPSGTTTHPIKKRRSWTCCGDRLTWATTGAGTNGMTPSSRRALCSAQVRRSFLSAATRTAAS